MLSQGTEAQAQTDSGQIHPILSQSLSFPTCKLGAMGSEVLTFYGDFGEERQFWRESLDFLGWRVGGMSLGLAFLGLGRGAPTTSQSSMSLWTQCASPRGGVPSSSGRIPSAKGILQRLPGTFPH